MTSAAPARTLEVRHLQIARAAFAALAAIMVTFSPDHSAPIGMAIFSGFAITTGIVLLIAGRWVYPVGRRHPAVALGVVAVIAGMIGGLPYFRTIPGFFGTVIAWALVSGAIEAIAGWRALRQAGHPELLQRREVVPGVFDSRPIVQPGPVSESRDGVVVGAMSLILGLALLFVPTRYALQYTIEEASETFTLTGITIGVGIFGAYTAIVAVYLAIAGLSPRKPAAEPTEVPVSAPADQKDSA